METPTNNLNTLQDTGKTMLHKPETLLGPFKNGDTAFIFADSTNAKSDSVTWIPSVSMNEKQNVNEVYAESVFSKHLLKTDRLNNKLRPGHREYWVPAVMLMVLSVFIWIKIKYPQRIIHVLKAFYEKNTLNQLLREEGSSLRKVSYYLIICFVLILSLFLYKVYSLNEYKLLGTNGPIIFLKLSLAIIVIYVVKASFLSFLGFLFDCRQVTTGYIYNVLIFNIIIGVLLSPIVILLYYLQGISSPFIINIGIWLIAIILFYRTINGFIAGYTSPGISKFYLFLYLCTLEIVPFFMLFKLVKNNLY